MKNFKSVSNKQQGATLVTSLMMLTIMTIVGVSAVKVSSTEILIAGNEQEKMKLFQTTQTDLNELSTPLELLTPLVGEVDDEQNQAEFDTNGEYTVSTSATKTAVSEEIISSCNRTT